MCLIQISIKIQICKTKYWFASKKTKKNLLKMHKLLNCDSLNVFKYLWYFSIFMSLTEIIKICIKVNLNKVNLKGSFKLL